MAGDEDNASLPFLQGWTLNPKGHPHACRPPPAPWLPWYLVFLDPKHGISAEKNDSTVKMKEFTAGSKAKTVQLADFKCLVCPLDVQVEKLPPKYDVCVWQGLGEQAVVESHRPLYLFGIGFSPCRSGRWVGPSQAPPQGTDQAPPRRTERAGLPGIVAWSHALSSCISAIQSHANRPPSNCQMGLDLSAPR